MMKEGALVVGCRMLGSSGVGEGGTSEMQAFMWRSHCVMSLCGGVASVVGGGGGTMDWCGRMVAFRGRVVVV
eukprot:13982110-Alexandrium_andersonii.AAC.1